jgi:hypothetical protein
MHLMDTRFLLGMVFITARETRLRIYLLKALEQRQISQNLAIAAYLLLRAAEVVDTSAEPRIQDLTLDCLEQAAALVVIQRLEQRTRLDSQVESDTALKAITLVSVPLVVPQV